ncbi:hypothetical protein HA402_010893 [Bradysia odoriphaga]|nr:hypothetical protein HA402_010893 [Bradysia odoriphaga]
MSNYDCYQKCKIRKVASGQYNLCGCLPSCSSLSYDVEFSLAKFRLQKYFAAKKQSFEGYECEPIQHFTEMYLYNFSHDVTRIFISFKDNQFFASRRSQLYGKTDFLANCGGLLGLFMGFSFLSLVEAVYFCTLRLACNLRRRHARKKKRLAMMTESFHKEERF